MTTSEIIEYREDHAMVPMLTLLEASAGTGKTYSVTLLYLRLLLEQGLEPQQIVVTTFTRAAAAELRERIHLRLAQAEQEIVELASRSPEDDTPEQRSIRGIVSRATVDDPIAAIVRAREKLDSSHISTIHTFAQALTNEFAMASGTPSNVELVDTPKPIIREVWQDLQYSLAERFPSERALFVEDPSLGAEVVELATRLTDDAQFLPFPAKILKGLHATEFLKVHRDASLGASPEILREAYAHRQIETDRRLRELGARADELGAEYLRWYQENQSNLNGTTYRGATAQKNLKKILRALKNGLDQAPGKASAALKGVSNDEIKFFLEEFAREKVKKNCSVTHLGSWSDWEFIAEARPVSALGRDYLVQQLALQVRVDTLRVMRERGLRSFSDMISDVCRTLRGENKALFVKSVRDKYKAAIIDEFQDTDESQWFIFNELFGAQSFTYLIGDPKQAIYAFRGANVAVYEKVRASLPNDRRMTLRTNYRSDKVYNEAVNGIFEMRAPESSYNEAVRSLLQNYIPVRSPDRSVERRLRWDAPYPGSARSTLIGAEEIDAAITLRHRVNAGKDAEGPFETLSAKEWIIEHCADEIAWALQQSVSTHAIFENGEWRALKPSDCAVLVRAKNAGNQILRALRKRQVPAVIRSQQSIAESDAASALFDWIDAVETPSNFSAIRTFLVSPLIGMTLNDVLALEERELVAWSTFFGKLQSRWWSDGFITALHQTLHSPVLRAAYEEKQRQLRELGEDPVNLNDEFVDVMSNLLRQLDGERIAADLLHLAELIHKAQERHKMSPAALRTWLSIQREDHKNESAPEAFRERVESDGFNVQIVTAHSSKGLEYPLVWCIGLTGKDRDYNAFSDPLDPTKRYPAAVKAVKNAFKKTGGGIEGLGLPIDSHSLEEAERWIKALYPSLSSDPLALRTESEGYDLDLEAANIASKNAGYADDLRLFYVALTRARLRCVVYRNQTIGTATGELLDHTDKAESKCDAPNRFLYRESGWSPYAFKLEEWDAASEKADGSSPHLKRNVFRRGVWNGKRPAARIAPPVLKTREGMTSFSSLSLLLPDHFAEHTERDALNDDAADRVLREDDLVLEITRGDTLPEPSVVEDDFVDEFAVAGDEASVEPEDGETPFAQFSSGKDAGTALHRIFEVADFESLSRDEAAYRETINQQILQELPPLGLSVEKDGAHLLEGVIAVLQTPLGGPLGDFKLANLPRRNRLDELEFTMALGHDATPAQFTEVFRVLKARKGDSAIWSGWFDALESAEHVADSMRGMMLGFIDLVFRAPVDGREKYFVADYKSNRIVPGDVAITSSAFTPDAMREEMSKHHYYLQYHIYLLALHRWLRTRIADYDYDTHIGGAYYLFVRGMTGANTPRDNDLTRGVFFDRPPKSIIEALDRALSGRNATAEGDLA